MNVSVGVLAVCPSPGKQWVRPLYSHPLIPIPDELARALAKLRGRKKRQTLPAACSKKTAVQAGLSADLPVPEELLRQVVMGRQPARAENEPMWFSICTKIANTAIANGYQDVGLRIFHDSLSSVVPNMMKQRQIPSLLELCAITIPSGASPYLVTCCAKTIRTC